MMMPKKLMKQKKRISKKVKKNIMISAILIVVFIPNVVFMPKNKYNSYYMYKQNGAILKSFYITCLYPPIEELLHIPRNS